MSAKQRRYPCSGSRTQQITESTFQISFHTVLQINIMALLKDQLWHILRSWYIGGGPEH